jgi:hypothetical protein
MPRNILVAARTKQPRGPIAQTLPRYEVCVVEEDIDVLTLTRIYPLPNRLDIN